METINDVYNVISSADMDYKSAVARSSGITGAKDRIKNLMFNHRSQILDSLRSSSMKQTEIDRLKERCDILEAELASVDDENNELRRKIRDMESEETPRKRKTKTMTAVVE